MKRRLFLIFLMVFAFIMYFCSDGKKEEKNANPTPVLKTDSVVTYGNGSLEGLTRSVLASIKDGNFANYVSHVMSREDELSQSMLIKSDSSRQDFLKRFGFSLQEEEEYFNDMVKFLQESKISLEKARLDEMIVLELENDVFQPVYMRQVIVPIDYDEKGVDLIFVAIRVKDRWFLTAELGI